MGDGELLQAQAERKGLCNQIYHTDCMELLAQIPDNYVSLILTDPPYGISYRNHFARQPHGLRGKATAFCVRTPTLIFLPVLTAIPIIMTV